MLDMEKLILEIEAYAAARNLLPTTVLQRAVGASGATWGKWKSGSSCSLTTADRIRAYMSANPPLAVQANEGDCTPAFPPQEAAE